MRISIWAGNYGALNQETMVRLSYDPQEGFHVKRAFGGLVNPSFLIPHSDVSVVYTVEETPEGAVCAWDMTKGELRLMGKLPTEGSDPCYLSISSDRRWLYAANYTSGSVACFALGEKGELLERTDLRQHTGSGLNPLRQEGPHAHCAMPLGDRIYVCDLGLDQILIYVNEQGKLHEAGRICCPPGSGPRHLAVRPGTEGKPDQLYCVTELSGEVLRIGLESDGTGKVLQIMPTIPTDFCGNTTAAAIHFTPEGEWLLTSQRGLDMIIAMPVEKDGALGEAVFSPCPREPRDFLLYEDRVIIGSQKDGYVEAFRLEEGHLIPTGHKISMVSPVCFQMVSKE